LAEKNNPAKKTIIIILCAIISVSVLSLIFVVNSVTLPETTVSLPEKPNGVSNYIRSMSNTHTFHVELGSPYFATYVTKYDFAQENRDDDGKVNPTQGVRLELTELGKSALIDPLKPNDGTVVIYPIFTSAAYFEPGFYTYFSGDCNESCITDVSFENSEFKYTSSGLTTQILYGLGYDFFTEIEVDKNPELLQNYDTVILLHNEYVTKKIFDAISNHPNLIFLFPNALYAEIDVNYDDNTMTLIRGHQYPPPENPANGFDYAIEQEFHHYEYDDQCLEWEFIEIENGFHLNCYPDGVIHKNLDILLKMKEL
jgi:hypothetical protein